MPRPSAQGHERKAREMDWRLRSGRRPALNVPGDAHELTFSCYRRFRLLTAERNCESLVDSIEQARERFNFALFAYVFMPDHVHLLVWPRTLPYHMSDILKAIKEPVGRRAIA